MTVDIHGVGGPWDSSTDSTHFTRLSSSLPFAVAENALLLEEGLELDSEFVITVLWTGITVL